MLTWYHSRFIQKADFSKLQTLTRSAIRIKTEQRDNKDRTQEHKKTRTHQIRRQEEDKKTRRYNTSEDKKTRTSIRQSPNRQSDTISYEPTRGEAAASAGLLHNLTVDHLVLLRDVP